MENVRQLLLVYVGVIVINLALSGLFWWRYRTSLHRGLFLVWLSSIVAGLVAGAPATGPVGVAFQAMPNFLVTLALAALIAGLTGLALRTRLYFGAVLLSVAGAVIANALAAPFWVVALPIAAATALPVFDVPVRALLRGEGRDQLPTRSAALSCLAYGVHMLDYPWLRDRPHLAVVGFSIALLVIFAISITAPAAVLDRVAEERTRVEATNRLQREFFANITHELRTPLTMMLASVESVLTAEGGGLTPVQRSFLEANWRNGVRLLKLINDLLDLAKLGEGFLRLRPEPADLRRLLEGIVTYCRPLAARKRLTLKLEVEETPTDVHADVEKLERVIVNLVSNALKFTESGGVTLRLGVEGDRAVIAVADTGIGITPEASRTLFQRFRQGDSSVTRRFGGSGLGLAYAKEIVELHGGRISLESTPGSGSVFTVRLGRGEGAVPEAVRDRRVADAAANHPKRRDDQEPLEWAQRLARQLDYRFADIEQVTDRRLVSRAEVAPSTTGRVLVVEDNVEILELVNLQLRDKYAIFVASNGRQGLEVARRERPDVVVTDFMMPEMDGLTMLKALRQEPGLADVPVVMLTAKNQLEDRLSVREAGADVYLEKPFSPRELEAAIRQLLAKQGRQVQNIMRAHVEGLEIVSAGLAHEIHNPLNFIKNANLLIAENVTKLHQTLAGFSDLPPERLSALDKVRDRIDRMVQSSGRGVERIEKVVDLIRRYAREGYPTEPSEVDFDLAVAEVTELVAPRADMEGRVSERLEAPGRLVLAIPEELNQVIRSLVQNACESVGEKGRVQVRTRVEAVGDGEQVVLEVVDDGPGIAPENVAKIFAPFFTTKPGSGRGMGLAIVQIVINRIGGTVEVTSTQAVETTFRVRLPVARRVAAGAPPPPAPVPELLSNEPPSSPNSSRPAA